MVMAGLDPAIPIIEHIACLTEADEMPCPGDRGRWDKPGDDAGERNSLVEKRFSRTTRS
jgi:hypothetical protein